VKMSPPIIWTKQGRGWVLFGWLITREVKGIEIQLILFLIFVCFFVVDFLCGQFSVRVLVLWFRVPYRLRFGLKFVFISRWLWGDIDECCVVMICILFRNTFLFRGGYGVILMSVVWC